MAFLEALPGKGFCSLTWQHCLGLHRCFRESQKTSERSRPFRKKRSWCLAPHLLKTKHTIPAEIPHTNCQHSSGVVMIWSCFSATGPRHLAVIDYAVKCVAVCLTAKAYLKAGRATGQCTSTEANLQHKGGKHFKKSMCCNDPVKVQTSTWLKCCGSTSTELRINEYLHLHEPKQCY